MASADRREEDPALDPQDLVPENPHDNVDPITGAPGAHPLGTGVGALGGGAAGAVAGAAAGPLGAAVGATIGGVAGGLIGKAVAEGINPTAEHEYWRTHFRERPYTAQEKPYEAYSTAYQFGWESYSAHRDSGRSFDDVEPLLAQQWETYRGHPDTPWEQVRGAARDAWERVEAADLARAGQPPRE